mmetsp:Transcript_12626/g.19055  ORF Transcript_12626/g.19055 Transcript_12626/m.19055 type:complete len:345 (-) Transcript_12626:246-1280(-)
MSLYSLLYTILYIHTHIILHTTAYNPNPSIPIIHVQPGEPIVLLEHVNINTGKWNALYSYFYFKILKLTSDPRADIILSNIRNAGGITDSLVWGNIGLQQFHFPSDYPQIIRGCIGLYYPNISSIQQDLIDYEYAYSISYDHNSLPIIETICPYGNRFRLHQQVGEATWYGPAAHLPPNKEHSLPGGLTEGRGMRYIEFDTSLHTAQRICEFYSYFLYANATTTTEFSESGPLDTCTIYIGYHQYISFKESRRPLPSYDGHHIALYVNRFVDIYERLVERSLHWENPRFPQFQYRSVDDILHHNEYRFKDIIDIHTGEVIYQLEHEIRSLSHPSFCCLDWVSGM